jgi:hypothetical protein
MPNNEKKRHDVTVYPTVVEATAQALKVSVDELTNQTKILSELLGKTNEIIKKSNEIARGTKTSVMLAFIALGFTIVLFSVSIWLQLR